MAIITGKDLFKPFICRTAGYVKSLLSSEHIEMNSGITLQEATDVMDYNLALSKNMITVFLPNNETRYKNVKIPFSQSIVSGDKLTLTNGGIKIGTGISKVEFSANVFNCGEVPTKYLWYKILKNNRTEIAISIAATSVSYTSVVFSPFLVNVSENDILTLNKITSENDIIRGGVNTWMTVRVIS